MNDELWDAARAIAAITGRSEADCYASMVAALGGFPSGRVSRDFFDIPRTGIGSDYWPPQNERVPYYDPFGGAQFRGKPRTPAADAYGRRDPADTLEKLEEYNDPTLDAQVVKRHFRTAAGEAYTALDRLTSLEAVVDTLAAAMWRARRTNSKEELRRKAAAAQKVRDEVRGRKPWDAYLGGSDAPEVTPRTYGQSWERTDEHGALIPAPDRIVLDPVSQAAKAAARDMRADPASGYIIRVATVQPGEVTYFAGYALFPNDPEVCVVNTYVYGGLQQAEMEVQLKAALQAARQSSAAFTTTPYMVALMRHLPDDTTRMIGAAVYRAGMTWDAARKQARRKPATAWEHAIYALMEK